MDNAKLTDIKQRAEMAIYGDEQNDFTYVASVCEDIPLLTAEVEYLSALLRQRDRQLEGERNGSRRTQAEVERLRDALRNCDAMCESPRGITDIVEEALNGE